MVVSNTINRTSGSLALASTALGLTLFYKQRILKEHPSEAHMLAFAGSVLALVAYDRWYDGMWPFDSREQAQIAQRNPG